MCDSEYSDVDNEAEEYVVEKILDKRWKGGETQYFVKWANYPDSDNTWEPAENVDSQYLIDAFEAGCPKKKKTLNRPSRAIPGRAGGPSNGGVSSRNGRKDDKDDDKDMDVDDSDEVEIMDKSTSGVDLNLTVQKIVSTKLVGGKLSFEFKFKGRAETEFVSSKIANSKTEYKKELIKFYSKQLAEYEKKEKA